MIYHWFSRNPVPAGTVRKITVLSPYQPDVTWKELLKAGMPFPPEATFGAEAFNTDPVGDRIRILSCEIAPPSVSREYVNSGQPAGVPIGHGSMTPPPVFVPPQQMPPGQPPVMGGGGAKDYEELGDAALPSSAEAMLGESSWDGGTYTDIDAHGNEVKRAHDGSQIPIAPRPTPQVGPVPQ